MALALEALYRTIKLKEISCISQQHELSLKAVTLDFNKMLMSL